MEGKPKISKSRQVTVAKQQAEKQKIAQGKGAKPRAKKSEIVQPSQKKEEVPQKLAARAIAVQVKEEPKKLKTSLLKTLNDLKKVYPNIFKAADLDLLLQQFMNLSNEKLEKFIKAAQSHLEEKNAPQQQLTPDGQLPKQPEIPENLRNILASTLKQLALDNPSIGDISQLNEQIVALPVEFIESFINAAVSQIGLRHALIIMLNALSEEYPNLFFGGDISQLLDTLINLPVEKITNFLKSARDHLAEKKAVQKELTPDEKLVKRREVPKDLRVSIAKVLNNLAQVYPHIGNISQLYEQLVGLPVELIEIYIKTTENKILLMQDLKKALIELKTIQPNLFFDGDIMPIYNQLFHLPNQQIKNFIKDVAKRVEEKRQEPQGWGEWFKTGAINLFDRTVKHLYQTGEENVEWMKASLGEYTSIFLSKAKDTSIARGGTKMLNVANATAKCAGNIGLATATLALPFITEWSYRIAMVVTGTQELGEEPAKEVKKEAQEMRKAVDQYLNATKISERPINDLTYLVTTTLYIWVKEDLIDHVLKSILPNASIRDLFSLVAIEGKELQKIIPEFMLNIAVTAFLTDFLGPQAIPEAKLPGYDPSWPTTTPAQLSSVNISILSSAIVTILLSGNLPLKKSLIKFFIKGPASLKNIGLVELVKKNQKRLLGSIGSNTVATHIFTYFLSKVTDKIIKKPAKTVIKKAIEYSYETTEKKLKSVIEEKEPGQSTQEDTQKKPK